MKNAAFLTYRFLFDPSETWSNLYQFESSIVKYFESLGFEAQVVKTIEGAAGGRILMISKKKEVIAQEKNPVGRPQSAGSRLKELAERKMRKPALEFMRKK